MEPGQQPHPDVYCDFPTCTRREIDTVIRLACFHCFHQACLPSNHCCPICAEPLKKKVQKLANTFNNGLLSSKNANEGENEDDDDLHEDESNNEPLTGLNISDAELFYTSPEWSQKIASILNTYATIPLLSQANHSSRNQPSPTNSLSPSSHVLTPIIIPPNHLGNVTFWPFPSSISQSTILGRRGSNACTFIALLFSKIFFSENVQIPVLNSPLSQTWVYQLIVQGILVGNRIYDSVSQNIPQTFGVSQALQSSTVLNNVIGGTTVGPEMPVSIIPEASPAANLPFHWRTALTQGKTASILILNSNAVVFIPTTQGVFLIASHIHGGSGAHEAFAEWQYSFELLSWFKQVNNFQFTLGTVTNVKFH